MTEAVDVASEAVPAVTGVSLEMSYVTQASAGATGTKTATASNDNDCGVAQILALPKAALSISSAANQIFYTYSYPPTTAISPITVSDHPTSPMITAANDIRIRIPSSFNMTWETVHTTATITGSAAAKVSSTVSYEDSGKTLVINVTSNFAACDTIVVSGLSYKNFSAASAADNLELELLNDGAVQAYGRQDHHHPQHPHELGRQ